MQHGVLSHPTSSIALPVRIVSRQRGSITIEAGAHIAAGALIISVDTHNGQTYPVRIGAGSRIGAGATIMPSVHIGENVIVAPGAVVMNNIPDRMTVSGTPAE